ncbi:SseB family protein [Homoserinimonas sp. OAct 916]|uniref:SseB family protein n=1 Tax=Homoserinimonas sp. OAct 916 TaxID=2211450 RepID=UPI000DBE6E41|nr:SseB family protein [Homoserinimonas sp. OAct 916]
MQDNSADARADGRTAPEGHAEHVLADPAIADSAGQPWAGRRFEENPFDGDDGAAAPELVGALGGFRNGEFNESYVIDVLRGVRLLIPLVAHAGDVGVNARGQKVDKTQELAIVTVAGPDGRTVLPVFSSVAAMSRWSTEARPVPASAVRVAQAAAGEQTDVVILDPTSQTEFAIKRPALWAMAKGEPWSPCYDDPAVHDYFHQSVAREPSVIAMSLSAGDPGARLAGPELIIRLELIPGLAREELDQILGRLQASWARSTIIADRVDSLSLQLAAST